MPTIRKLQEGDEGYDENVTVYEIITTVQQEYRTHCTVEQIDAQIAACVAEKDAYTARCDAQVAELVQQKADLLSTV